jgi:hypothetical protein
MKAEKVMMFVFLVLAACSLGYDGWWFGWGRSGDHIPFLSAFVFLVFAGFMKLANNLPPEKSDSSKKAIDLKR